MKKLWILALLFVIVFTSLFRISTTPALAPAVEPSDEFKGFVTGGCFPTDSQQERYLQIANNNKVSTDNKVKVTDQSLEFITGKIKASVLKEKKAYFEGQLLSRIIVPLPLSMVSTALGNYTSLMDGSFRTPILSSGKTFSVILRSPTIYAFNDDPLISNQKDYCYLINGDKYCFKKNAISVNRINPQNSFYEVNFNSTGMSDLTTINAYYHVLKAEEWSTSDNLWNATTIQVRANFFPFCNAQFMPQINWIMTGKASTWVVNNQTVPCANTGFSTVVQHEYGHAFLNSIIGYPIPSTFIDSYAYHEAIADTLSSFSLDTPCMGEDLFGPGSGCTRNLDNDSIYPVNSSDLYKRSAPLSGAFWDLRKELINRLGKQKGSETARMLFIETIKSYKEGLSPSIREALLQIDTDNFKSANIEIINEVFSAHGL